MKRTLMLVIAVLSTVVTQGSGTEEADKSGNIFDGCDSTMVKAGEVTTLPKDTVYEPDYDLSFELISQFEGFRSKSYHCTKGVRTIGYGTTEYLVDALTKDGYNVGFTLDDTITEKQGRRLLVKYVEIIESKLVKIYGEGYKRLHPYVRSAIHSRAYQIGWYGFVKNVVSRNTELERGLVDGDNDKVVECLSDWSRCKYKDRREKEYKFALKFRETNTK